MEASLAPVAKSHVCLLTTSTSRRNEVVVTLNVLPWARFWFFLLHFPSRPEGFVGVADGSRSFLEVKGLSSLTS